ncbi:hypothetical protein NMG60_11004666 [Bertholletia excelsa]
MIFKCWEWLKIFGDDSLHQVPATPSPVTELCDDVLANILHRVKPDTLARFKCVNRESRRLISDPEFLQKYRSQLPHPTYPLAGFFYHHQHTVDFKDFSERSPKCLDRSLGFFPNPVRILASRNGLVLCTTGKTTPLRYYVCNPITKRFVILPESKYPYDSYSTGFFVDSDYGHYQVVRIPSLVARNHFAFVETFSSETGKWRLVKLELPSPYCLFSLDWPAVQWKRLLLWVDGLRSILAYDVTQERFKFLDLPHVNPRNQCQYKRVVIKYGMLGVSGGLLSYVFTDTNSVTTWVRVCKQWVMAGRVSPGFIASNNSEVRRIIRTSNPEGVSGCGWRGPAFRPLCFNEFDPRVVFLRLPGCIVSYHFQQRCIEVVQELPEDEKIEIAFPYVVPQLPFDVHYQLNGSMRFSS